MKKIFGLCLFLVFSLLVAVAQTPAAETGKSICQLSVIPNPARGKKVTFRFIAKGPIKVHLRIIDRFFDPIDDIVREGDGLFDILWSLKKIPAGMYQIQARVEDKATGQSIQLPLQKFVVLK